MVEKILIACPNCGQPAHKEGSKVTCENCDAIYSITKTGSAKVKKLGPIEDHEQRIAKMEAALFPPDEPPPEEPAPEEFQETDENDEDQIL